MVAQPGKKEREKEPNAQDFIKTWRYAVAVEEGGVKLASFLCWLAVASLIRFYWSPCTSGKTDSLTQVKGSSWSPCAFTPASVPRDFLGRKFCLSCVEPGCGHGPTSSCWSVEGTSQENVCSGWWPTEAEQAVHEGILFFGAETDPPDLLRRKSLITLSPFSAPPTSCCLLLSFPWEGICWILVLFV